MVAKLAIADRPASVNGKLARPCTLTAATRADDDTEGAAAGGYRSEAGWGRPGTRLIERQIDRQMGSIVNSGKAIVKILGPSGSSVQELEV